MLGRTKQVPVENCRRKSNRGIEARRVHTAPREKTVIKIALMVAALSAVFFGLKVA